MKSALLNQFRGVLWGLALADWRRLKSNGAQSSLPLTVSPWLQQLTALASAETSQALADALESDCINISTAPLAIALAQMPRLLLLHQHSARLQSLAQSLTAVRQPVTNETLTLCWLTSAVLDLALQDQLSSAASLQLDLASLQPPDFPLVASGQQPVWQGLLSRLEPACQQPTGLQAWQSQLETLETPLQFQPFWLALYIVLTTPHDYGLAIERSLRAIAQPDLTAALVGAWLGAKLGQSGLPLAWQSDFSRAAGSGSVPLSALQIQTLADRLFARWCGISGWRVGNGGPLPAIALP
ncbi:ADP-ribosylglycohydrolase family protein [Sphaerothrix gracilis]|uniref:ADP-ribosylglycohydrolase family protein n=1 Tax=Sphaerothrix gracilis TaxID=3151835 RepID=UPI0031FBF28A